MSESDLTSILTNHSASSAPLEDGDRVAVIGGGPAGSFFSYFLLQFASRVGLNLRVDLFEPRDFGQTGPASCNMCGGIVSESLVQLLATEGINLPPNVVQRGIDSYMLHTDVGSVRIDPPGHEKRIAAVHRGGGPRGRGHGKWDGFDGYLLDLAISAGATHIPKKVDSVSWEEGRPLLDTREGRSDPYALAAVAVGINGHGWKLLEQMGSSYAPPSTTKTFICELLLGEEGTRSCLGDAMHVFLLNIPRLEFAALIPKGEYATLVLLGSEIDRELVDSFLGSAAVKQCLPPEWDVPKDYCRCFPSINVGGTTQPFNDRIVFVGDCGESRLYKDGIGGAYRTAKAAAKTAVFSGVSKEDFRRGYLPVCRSLAKDNRLGKVVFSMTHALQALKPTRRALLRTVRSEQAANRRDGMSEVLWDTFTGSAPYRDIARRIARPGLAARFLFETARGFIPPGAARRA